VRWASRARRLLNIRRTSILLLIMRSILLLLLAGVLTRILIVLSVILLIRWCTCLVLTCLILSWHYRIGFRTWLTRSLVLIRFSMKMWRWSKLLLPLVTLVCYCLMRLLLSMVISWCEYWLFLATAVVVVVVHLVRFLY